MMHLYTTSMLNFHWYVSVFAMIRATKKLLKIPRRLIRVYVPKEGCVCRLLTHKQVKYCFISLLIYSAHGCILLIL